MTPPQPSGSTATADKSSEVTFLVDWKKNHRELTDEQREHVGNYIRAIVAHTGGADENPSLAADLWIKFRNTYDELGAGRYGKTNREDVQKAMRLL